VYPSKAANDVDDDERVHRKQSVWLTIHHTADAERQLINQQGCVGDGARHNLEAAAAREQLQNPVLRMARYTAASDERLSTASRLTGCCSPVVAVAAAQLRRPCQLCRAEPRFHSARLECLPAEKLSAAAGSERGGAGRWRRRLTSPD